MNKKVKHGTLLTVIFTLLSLLYLYPIILVFINSFKKKAYISKAPFEIPTGTTPLRKKPISVKHRSRYRPERCMSD